jgi:hypothetical protein
MDATEQRIQRPQDNEFQKQTYSGKKKTNTLKGRWCINTRLTVK